jgi:hypothetical protein
MNLCKLSAVDCYRFAHKCLDQLFSREEQSISLVEPVTSDFAALDGEKIKILKSKLKFLMGYSIININNLIFRCSESKI